MTDPIANHLNSLSEAWRRTCSIGTSATTLRFAKNAQEELQAVNRSMLVCHLTYRSLLNSRTYRIERWDAPVTARGGFARHVAAELVFNHLRNVYPFPHDDAGAKRAAECAKLHYRLLKDVDEVSI